MNITEYTSATDATILSTSSIEGRASCCLVGETSVIHNKNLSF